MALKPCRECGEKKEGGGNGPDASTKRLLIDHYDCKFLPQGSGVEIVERGPVVTTVAPPNLFLPRRLGFLCGV